MTSRSRPARSMRRRLFVSHLVVIFVAIGVFGFTVGIAESIIDGRHGGGGDDGPAGLLLGVAAAVTAAALVSWRVTRRLARPIEAVGTAARDLAAGRYDVRVPDADISELSDLASDVNSLAAELDDTERQRLRLIGDVAHELRNPLSTIEGTMEALLDGVLEADDDTYTRVGREASRLRRLADDLSSLSAAGEMGVLDAAPVDLAVLAADVVAQLRPQAAAKDLAITIDGPGSMEIVGDRDRLTQVLTNVVGNAVQYTDAGTVAVRVTSTSQTARVDVSDTGRGLAAEDHARIFQRFHRVDEHFADGTGVGLAIAKMLVGAHGGSIRANSPGLGRGTTITIELPHAVG